MRIASVLPSATEIVSALGAESELVGRSEECDYPPGVRAVPVLMRARTLDQDRASGEIDRRVREARARGESLYELDLDALARARPDVLLTQDLCRVCSVTEDEVEEACDRVGVRPRVVAISPTTLEEVWRSVESIGEAIGRRAEAATLVRRLRERSAASPSSRTPSVAVVEWLDPPILAGLWTPEIVRRAGGSPIGPDPGTPASRTTWDDLGSRRPELTVLSPCSFPVERTLHELSEQPSIARSIASALRTGPVVVADEAYFSRPGPRLADGVELVRGLLAGSHGPFSLPVVPLPAPPSGGSR